MINKMENRLYRDENHKILGGVAAGLANYFNIDVSIIRIIFLFSGFFFGTGFWVYIIMWIVVPAKFTFMPGVDFSNMAAPQPAPGPATGSPVRSASAATVVIGAILITFGTIFLLCEYDILPDWEYHKLWPLVFVIAGIAVMFGGGKRKSINEQFAETPADDAEQNDTPETI
jgi:phage shock protein C